MSARLLAIIAMQQKPKAWQGTTRLLSSEEKFAAVGCSGLDIRRTSWLTDAVAPTGPPDARHE
jgi:hypothetical protein